MATATAAKRNRPTFSSDYLLVEETLNKDPFSASKPTQCWATIATNLEATKERIGILLNAHDKEDTANLKRSGTEEEFDHFQAMLGDLSTLRKSSQVAAAQVRDAKAKKKEEEDLVGTEILAAGENTFAKSIAGSSNGEDWEEEIDSEAERQREEQDPGYIRRRPRRRKRPRTGGKDLTEDDIATVFTKQDELTFQHKKMELQQIKELKEMELLQDKELRQKEIAARELEARLNHDIRLKELEIERERIELRKREIALLENAKN